MSITNLLVTYEVSSAEDVAVDSRDLWRYIRSELPTPSRVKTFTYSKFHEALTEYLCEFDQSKYKLMNGELNRDGASGEKKAIVDYYELKPRVAALFASTEIPAVGAQLDNYWEKLEATIKAQQGEICSLMSAQIAARQLWQRNNSNSMFMALVFNLADTGGKQTLDIDGSFMLLKKESADKAHEFYARHRDKLKPGVNYKKVWDEIMMDEFDAAVKPRMDLLMNAPQSAWTGSKLSIPKFEPIKLRPANHAP